MILEKEKDLINDMVEIKEPRTNKSLTKQRTIFEHKKNRVESIISENLLN